MKQQILVVDDEAPTSGLLSDYFKKYNYDVSSAATAGDALRFIDEQQPHLVILDVLLADTDGLDLLSQIKSARPKLPVIIMTGIGFDEELLQGALQKGAASYVSKTAPLEQLLVEVRRILNQRK